MQSNSMSGAFGVLRQELDTLVRVMFLLRQGIGVRRTLVQQTLDGERWKLPSGKLVTDRVMVDLANELEGWSEYVYKLGCAFIHLSDFHSGEDVALAARLSPDQCSDIRRYVQHYHGVQLSDEVRLSEVYSAADRIFEKISDNLEFCLEYVEDEEADIV